MKQITAVQELMQPMPMIFQTSIIVIRQGILSENGALIDKCGNTTEKSQVIRIEPTPKVSASPSLDTLCNGEQLKYHINKYNRAYPSGFVSL